MAVTKIAVLDDYQGAADSYFEKLDSTKYEVTSFKDTLRPYNHPDTPQSEQDALVQRLEPFHVLSTMRERTPFPAELINRLPNLKLLLTTGPRNAAIDLSALEKRGIPSAGTSGKAAALAAKHPKMVGTDSTTQHCVTLILGLARNIAHDDATMKAGGWQTGFATGLSRKTIGLVGLGRLGATVAKIMHAAFAMRVIAWSENLTQAAADEKAKDAGFPVEDSAGEKTYKVVSRDELFSTADVVSMHLILSDRTKGLINAQDLARMKPSALLVNTSRGPLIVEKDLFDVLKAGKIRGAATDVFDVEPLPVDSEWRSHEWGKNGRSQVLITPHMGYVEETPITTWYAEQVENIERWAKGEELTTPLIVHPANAAK